MEIEIRLKVDKGALEAVFGRNEAVGYDEALAIVEVETATTSREVRVRRIYVGGDIDTADHSEVFGFAWYEVEPDDMGFFGALCGLGEHPDLDLAEMLYGAGSEAAA